MAWVVVRLSASVFFLVLLDGLRGTDIRLRAAPRDWWRAENCALDHI
jgi:hypothetical protein